MALDFLAGGLAAISAITLVHPIDVVKSRMNFAGELGKNNKKFGVVSWILHLAREEGLGSLYRGLSAAYALQFTVTATRFGTYSFAKSILGDEKKSDLTNFLLAGASGGKSRYI